MATLLVAEHDNKTLKDATNKALTAAKAMGADVDVLIAGKDCKGAADAAAKLDGVKKVLLADAPVYEHQLAEPLAALIVSLAPKYDAIIAPATTTGKNVMPRVAAPPLVPTANVAGGLAMPISTVEQIARGLRQSGDAGRRVTVVGTMRNVGTTYAAISLARTLGEDSNVVLVDLAFGAPNLSVISTDPKAPGLAELIRGTASFGDIITRDQFSQVHLISTGEVSDDAAVPDDRAGRSGGVP